MENKRYYYRFNVGSELGKRFRQFWNVWQKADRARTVFLNKIGAKGYIDDERMLVGRVLAVSFAEDEKTDLRQWREVGKDGDGTPMYAPNVEHRTGFIVLPRKGFKPSDTAHRIYDRRIYGFRQVSMQMTAQEWATVAGIRLTGDKERDDKRLRNELADESLARYTDIYHPDYDPQSPECPRRIPWWARQAVTVEILRLRLPVLSFESLYTLLQAESPLPEGKTHGIVSEQVPNFFEWTGRYYVSSDRPLHADGLEPIEAVKYTTRQLEMERAHRAAQQQEPS